ncbi:MAG TPA: hypothetical protein VFM48_11655 [Aquabacterium sp.]|nr:hypothetical protein [Aquabacterium sp.]
MSTAAALSGRFDGWLAFQDHLNAAMAMVAAAPVDLYLCDLDFGHWPLGSRAVLDAFHQWVMAAGRSQCHVMTLRPEELTSEHPRWVAWRQPWKHRVKCYQMPEELVQGLPPMFIARGQLGIRVLDERSGAGIWSRDPATIGAWLTDLDVILQRSHEAEPGSTLGL